MKKYFLKCPKKSTMLKENYSGCPRPVTTRRGTWINAVKCYCKNYNGLKNTIEEFGKGTECARVAKIFSEISSVQSNLECIVCNFGFYLTRLLKLETRGNKYLLTYVFTYILKYTVYVLGVLLSKSVDILYDVQNKLEECNGESGRIGFG